MSKKIRHAEQLYRLQIEPLITKLTKRCKHFGLPVLVAVPIHIAGGAGVTALMLQPGRDGFVPANFNTVWALLNETPPAADGKTPEVDAVDAPAIQAEPIAPAAEPA